ncbi:MAG: arsenic efflux protein [Clostridia bacterium]|nr:arsenic efflux protein [Clostridia bacterium]
MDLHELLHILEHALVDSAKAVPFLFLAYLLMEAAEHYHSAKMEKAISGIGKAGPLVGALLGCVPQCGFSASASNLFAAGLLSRGTLLAVFLATSDEALPMLLGAAEGRGMILPLLLAKVLIGILAGYVIDFYMNRWGRPRELFDLCEDCGCEEEGSGILKPALWHTGHILLYIFLLSLGLGLAMELLGEDLLGTILLKGSLLQPFVAALVGLIPNCAVSVTLTQLYLAGSLSFGSLLAGLCSGAGLGVAVLLKMNRSKRENIQIMALLYVIAALCGLAVHLVF